MTNKQCCHHRHVLIAGFVLATGVVVFTCCFLDDRPLSLPETHMIGRWDHFPNKTSTLVFAADRSWSSTSGFVGRWSIVDGQLHLTYWSDGAQFWGIWLPTRKISNETWNIKFDKRARRAELAWPTAPTRNSLLVRDADQSMWYSCRYHHIQPIAGLGRKFRWFKKPSMERSLSTGRKSVLRALAE